MIYRVGNIDVDTINFHLSENGSSIAVEPLVFDLIVYLISHRDRLVTREELFDKLWIGKVVSDTSLSNHIKSARKVLGDDGHNQQVIKTIHGRGYQFIARIEESVEQSNEINTTKNVSSNDLAISIAVLAFTDLSPKQNQEYFSDGISDELINLLSKIPDLRVVSRTSSFSFKGTNTTSEKIGLQLNVTHLLEGSVRKASNQLRITVQLIKVSDDSHLWSETFNDHMDNIFRIQDDIAEAVVKQLRITLLGSMAKTSVVKPEAYNLYLEAKYLCLQFNEESLIKAENVIHESLKIDPDYAPSWFVLGNLIRNGTMNYFIRPLQEGLELSKSAMQKSIELDSENAIAYVGLAAIHVYKSEFKDAENNINKALLLGSENSVLIEGAGNIYSDLGQIEKAIELTEKAININPVHCQFHLGKAIYLYLLNKFDEALVAFDRFRILKPDHAYRHHLKAMIFMQQGKFREALNEIEDDPDEEHMLFPKVCVLFSLGKQNDANRLLSLSIEQYGSISPSAIAKLYAYRKDNKFTFQWLERAFSQSDPSLIENINYPEFRNVWDDPRWCMFLTKMKLPKKHWLIK